MLNAKQHETIRNYFFMTFEFVNLSPWLRNTAKQFYEKIIRRKVMYIIHET